MADRPALNAAPRGVLGKKVRRLRREGLLPANVYGRGIPSLAVQLNNHDFVRTVKHSGARGMFELTVEGEAKPRYVLLRGLTRQGGMGDPVHADFYQVDLEAPVETHVHVRLTGVAPAVRDLAGTLLLGVEMVTVRCLPLQIPEAIEADATLLKGFDTTIVVGDLRAPAGVTILTDASVVVASVAPPRIQV